jgi:hypothetical protein
MKQDDEFGLFKGMKNALLIYAASAVLAVLIVAIYKLSMGSL